MARDRLSRMDDFPTVLIEVPETMLSPDQLQILEWRPSGVKDIWYRVNPARPENGNLRNVHVAHQKNIKGKAKQASWNELGRRHDKMTFDDKVGSKHSVKAVARKALGLPPETILEYVPGRAAGVIMLLERLEDEQRPTARLTVKVQ